MSFLEYAIIRTKILSVLLPLCPIDFGSAGTRGLRDKQADTGYADFIAIKFVSTNRNDDARSMLAQADAVIVGTNTNLSTFVEKGTQGVVNESDKLTDRTNSTITIALSIMCGWFLIGIIAALFVIFRRFTTPHCALSRKIASAVSGKAAIDTSNHSWSEFWKTMGSGRFVPS